jgi:CNT family concentrative nucleoside transporter
MAWSFFIVTAALMVLGATLSPQGLASAQDAPSVAEQGADMAVAPDAGVSADQGVVPAAPPVELAKPEVEDAPSAQEVKPDVQDAPPARQAVRAQVGKGNPSGVLDRAVSFLGIFAIIGLAWLMSSDRKRVNWKLVGIGVGLQVVFALIIFYMPGGQFVFATATAIVQKCLDFTSKGSSFLFSSFVTGKWEAGLINFPFAVLPTIIFFSSLMTILYHVGAMQRVVRFFAFIMQRTMGTSGAESLSAAANIFVGQTEAPLVIKPYVQKMTESELMTVMTGGFATVAGGVMAIYVGMLQPKFPDIAGHLLAASVMSAPAALVIGKIMIPETGVPETAGTLEMNDERPDKNVIDAASRGAGEGMTLAINVFAMLLAFIAIVAMLNYIVGLPSLLYNESVLKGLVQAYTAKQAAIPAGCDIVTGKVAEDAVLGCIMSMKAAAGQPDVWVAPAISIQQITGYLFWPLAWIMGVPASDCLYIGQLLGEKIVLNELVAYSSLQKMLDDPNIVLQDRSVIIATYALCGFANLGSIGIQLGGIGGIAPERRGDLAKIAYRAMIAGTLAACMTATVAGILV